jgi:hypothetical protein
MEKFFGGVVVGLTAALLLILVLMQADKASRQIVCGNPEWYCSQLEE